MKLDVITLEAGKAGDIDLSDDIFGLEPRADLLHRVVRWQRAKAQQGTHSVLGKSDVSYSTKKIYRQKGTGGARHGSRKAPTFRHGGVYKGPTPRSHAFDLPKKVRALGLKHALSAKVAAGELVIVDSLNIADAKTSAVAKAVKEQPAGDLRQGIGPGEGGKKDTHDRRVDTGAAHAIGLTGRGVGRVVAEVQ